MWKPNFFSKSLVAGVSILLCYLGGPVQVLAADFESAKDAVVNMGLGWNLGNTLDAYSQKNSDPASADFWGQQDLSSETFWQQPYTKPELIQMMKEAGFGAIRVPVTWFNHMDANGEVSPAWMARVHEVVDYVVNAGLYCIINVHHDTGADNMVNGSPSFVSWIKADEANYNKNKARFEHLWQQIAEEFKDYDQHLLFEGYNEMLDRLNSWCFASFAANGQYDAEVAKSAYNAVNSYAQSFVTTVRATGGNNAQRNLIVNTYAACSGHGNWNDHLKDPLKSMALPHDNVEGHIAFEVHSYPSIEGDMSSVKAGIDDMFAALNTHLIKRGAPVIIGEWSSENVDKSQTDYDLRRDRMFEFVDYYLAKAKKLGIATFYWMGLSDGTHRSIPSFHQPDLAERLAKAWHGSNFQGKYPTMEQADVISLFEGTKDLEWGSAISLNSSIFTEENRNKLIEITYKQNFTDYDDIQFCYGDWNGKPTVIVDSMSYAGDFSPADHYGTPTGTEHVTAFKFPDDSYNLLSQKGLQIQGHGIQVFKVSMVSKSSASISSPHILPTSNDLPLYDLQGRRVKTPTRPGIYITGDKKCIFNR